jgi:hypothetical protein
MMEKRPVVLIAINNAPLNDETLLKRVAVAVVELSNQRHIDHLIAFSMLAADHGQTQEDAENKYECDKPPAETHDAARHCCYL